MIYKKLLLIHQFTDRGGREVYGVHPIEVAEDFLEVTEAMGQIRLDVNDVQKRVTTRSTGIEHNEPEEPKEPKVEEAFRIAEDIEDCGDTEDEETT